MEREKVEAVLIQARAHNYNLRIKLCGGGAVDSIKDLFMMVRDQEVDLPSDGSDYFRMWQISAGRQKIDGHYEWLIALKPGFDQDRFLRLADGLEEIHPIGNMRSAQT